jgi:predicted XRE-type DNA-binding protein
MSDIEVIGGIEIEASRGNVFEDLGHADAEEKLARADLSIAIARAIRDRGLTQTMAAGLLGCAQPDVSRLMRGQVRGFTIERLASYLTALGQDVEIVVRPAGRDRGRIVVRT